MRVRPFAVALFLVLAAACSTVPPLAHAQRSPEAVATVVLDAIATRDRVRLTGLALSEQEFRDHIWPALPAARPERNLPFSYVWGDLRQKSEQSLAETLAAHGGQRYELVGVAFDGTTDYGPYTVHREARLSVRDAFGRAMTVRICGSMVEKDGLWKVFSYVVDS